MMKKLLVLVLVPWMASGAGAALSLVGGPTGPIQIGDTTTVTVANSVKGAYSGWLSITDPLVADFGNLQFTAAGNPNGVSTTVSHPEYGAWIEFTVASVPPTQIVPGDHLQVAVVGLSEGTTRLNLYGVDGEVVVASVDINVIPEPMTIALLGLGGLVLLRRT
jgi:hypothetical protein